MGVTTLLALDLASRSSGWCCGDGLTVPIADAWTMPEVGDADGADYGALLSALKAYLDAAFVRFPTIQAVGYEAPIVIHRGPRTDPLWKLRLLLPLGPFVEWYCRDVAGVPCHEIGVQEAKKEITGKANAEKEDIARIAEKCGLVLPTAGRLDASDAWAVWKRMLRAYSPAVSAQWDRRIHSPRGALI